MKKHIVLYLSFILLTLPKVSADTVIQMESYGGVYRIPCLVNGAKMKFIFDTGASSVCLSMTMAQYLYDNEYITDEDIIGKGQSSVADGRIVDHVRIILKEITIGDKKLKNVEAIVMSAQQAPLLLGQTVLKKLGRYTISGDKLIIQSTNYSVKKDYSEDEIVKLFDQAKVNYKNGAYYAALNIYKILNEIGELNAAGKLVLGDCYLFSDDSQSALDIYLEIKQNIEKDYPDLSIELYEKIALCYDGLDKEDEAAPYFEEIRRGSQPWSSTEVYATSRLARIYAKQSKHLIANKILKEYIDGYLKYKGYNINDCWDKKITDMDIADLFYSQYYVYDVQHNITESSKYLKLAAAWGDDYSINLCKNLGIYYSSKPYDFK